MAVVGFLTSSLVTEISKLNSIEWSQIPNKFSAYLLFIFLILHGVYQYFSYIFEKEPKNPLTAKQFESELRGAILPTVTDLSKKLLSENKVAELETTITTVMKTFGGKNK